MVRMSEVVEAAEQHMCCQRNIQHGSVHEARGLRQCSGLECCAGFAAEVCCPACRAEPSLGPSHLVSHVLGRRNLHVEGPDVVSHGLQATEPKRVAHLRGKGERRPHPPPSQMSNHNPVYASTLKLVSWRLECLFDQQRYCVWLWHGIRVPRNAMNISCRTQSVRVKHSNASHTQAHLRLLLQRRYVLYQRHVGAPDGVAVTAVRLRQLPLQPQHLPQGSSYHHQD